MRTLAGHFKRLLLRTFQTPAASPFSSIADSDFHRPLALLYAGSPKAIATRPAIRTASTLYKSVSPNFMACTFKLRPVIARNAMLLSFSDNTLSGWWLNSKTRFPVQELTLKVR